MTYETVNIFDSEETKSNQYESDIVGKQISDDSVPVYEMQYEPVDMRDGDKGTAQSSTVRTKEMKNDTICNHSYEVIREKCDTILEESTDGSIIADQQDQKWKVNVTDKRLQQCSTDVGMYEGDRPQRKRASYENVLSFDVSCYDFIP